MQTTAQGTNTADGGIAGDTGAPRLVRRAVFGALALTLAGSAYLIAVRGEAIIVDLATLGARMWCF